LEACIIPDLTIQIKVQLCHQKAIFDSTQTLEMQKKEAALFIVQNTRQLFVAWCRTKRYVDCLLQYWVTYQPFVYTDKSNIHKSIQLYIIQHEGIQGEWGCGSNHS